MRIIRHHPCIEFLRQCKRIQRRAVAVHAEHGFGEYQAMMMFGTVGFQEHAAMRQVIMGKTHHRRARQSRAVNHACMDKFIGQYQITRPNQRRNGTDISKVSAAEDTGGFRMLIRSKQRFQFII